MPDDLRYREIKTKLTARSSRALGELAARTNLSEVDIVNRALQIYAYVEAEQAAGRQILTHDEREGETHVLRWF
ncbi:hypothetical protein FH608_046285 [Nonomuraea phyllanthi]|uniref:CopG family transcriptional regulator n=1 Tax=Nonomuraea phyllanthi TaxID=2219224 RepID=A0A5C4V6T6_9ACTN|nr:hypothetical protein [Nonomuraea phyllanthi]KAB8186904.1 hypothetical protein FH608_046285 [Nonomuraea phyllanthi]